MILPGVSQNQIGWIPLPGGPFAWGPTGGVGYHATALRYRKTLWRPFINNLDLWFHEAWQPHEKELVIFGSSAGWTLSKEFLKKFRTTTVIEPDPIARILFRERHRDLSLQTIARHDLLPWFSPERDDFARFLNQHKNNAILFSNVLGQVPLLERQFRRPAEEAREVFWKALKGRNWASYHDLLSTDSGRSRFSSRKTFAGRQEPGVDFAANGPGGIDLTKVLDRLIPPSPTTERDRGRKTVSYVDHDTLWLHQRHAWRALKWELTPRATHIIGCVHSQGE
jgi:hypothetical protein